MSSSSLFFLSTIFALGFLVLMVVATPPECGYIFDGSTPLVDIDRQADSTQLRANWYGFYGVYSQSSTGGSTGSTGSTTGYPFPIDGPLGSTGGSTGSTGTTGRSTGLIYQVAVISEKKATKSIINSGPDASNSYRCRATPGFSGNPDVQNFQTVTPTQKQSSEGFLVDVWKSGKLNLTKGVKYYVVLKVSARNGRSLYTNTDGLTIGTNGSGSDDDDGFPPYKAGLIAMGIAICCLLVLLLLLILVAKGKGEDKYTTTVHRNENVDKL